MKRFFLICLVVLTSTSLVFAQDDPNQSVKFTVDVDNAILWHGEESDDWDNPYTDPGTVVYHDGNFHMFRNGFRGWPDKVDIGYLTSEDGLTWTEVTEEPIFLTDDAPFDVTAVLASSALVEDDGTWVLYFYAWPRIGGSDPSGVVRATASEPLGPWTMDDTYLITPGEAGTWDAGQITAPSVVKTSVGYEMFYSGINADGVWQIGRAASEDGLNWVKDENPVFGPAADPTAWDGDKVHQPRVRITPDGYVMLYRAFTGAGRNKSFGLAISEDGKTWERVSTEPAFSDRDTGRRGIWYSELEYHDGTYFVFLEIQRNFQNQTDIYVGTYTGTLR